MLVKDLKYLKAWVKQASKRHSDKYVRGFVDSVIIIDEVLNNIEELVVKVAQETDLIDYDDDIKHLVAVRLEKAKLKERQALKRAKAKRFESKTKPSI